MTYEQNVKAILETNFAGFKEEIIDIACERICMLETKEEIIDRVLAVIDEVDEEYMSWHGIIEIIRDRVKVLKGGQK